MDQVACAVAQPRVRHLEAKLDRELAVLTRLIRRLARKRPFSKQFQGLAGIEAVANFATNLLAEALAVPALAALRQRAAHKTG